MIGELPVELWILILSFLNANEEFPVASVCKLFYNILSEKREKTGSTKWRTNIVPFCKSMNSIDFIGNTCSIETWPYIKTQIPRVIATQMNYDILIGFMERMQHRTYYDGLYEVLLANGAYDTACRLITNGKIELPYNGIRLAIGTGQIDLIVATCSGFLYNIHSNVVYDTNDDIVYAALNTCNIDIVKAVLTAFSRRGLRIYVPMQTCVYTGNLDIIKYVFEIIRPRYIHPELIRVVLEKGNDDILEYLLTHNGRIYESDFQFLKRDLPNLAAQVKNYQVEKEEYEEDDW